MKKKSKPKLFRLGITVSSGCAIIALLEAFNLHPQFSMGSFHAYWSGVSHMDFESGTMTAPVAGREKVIQRDYDIGPVKIAIEI